MELTYKEKLLDERWLDKRERLLRRAGHRCGLCSECEGFLTIHHGYYRFKTDPWDYEDESLWVLCWPCHEKTQLRLVAIHQAIGHTHPRDLEKLKLKVTDAAFEVQFGIPLAEAEELLREERAVQSTLFSDYSAAIMACSELGPTVAYEIESLATREFPGLSVHVRETEHDPDAVASVEGPDHKIARRIQAFLDHEREKRA